MTSLLIETILKTKSIVDYLASKGHHPVGGEVNGRLRYRCPLHLEKTPSFNVYTGGEYENFFCFGCKKRYNIIHLYRDMENVSIKDAIKSLGGDLNIDVESEINYAVQQIQNDHSLRNEFTPPELALMISRAAFDFLRVVELE
jgi:DNA primase